MAFWESHADAIITSIITVIGFAITVIINRKSIRDEIRKEKVSSSNKVIQELPYEICQMLDSVIHRKNKISVSDYSSILDRVLSYGSAQAVVISIELQKTII